MGLAGSFLSASKEEWSLIRRHPDEQMFGIQLAGNKPSLLTPAAEVIARECAGGIDFVDLNCGCPIDLVFKTGSGSARACFELLNINLISDVNKVPHSHRCCPSGSCHCR